MKRPTVDHFIWIDGQCKHRSHRLGLRCLRSWRWDGYCHKHIETCWAECK